MKGDRTKEKTKTLEVHTTQVKETLDTVNLSF